MNILFISYLFPPVNNPQAVLSARTVKFLSRLGHKVTVIAASGGEIYNSSHGVDAALLRDIPTGDIHYVKDVHAPNAIRTIKSKLIYHENYGYWVKNAVARALAARKESGYDVIYSIAAPMASNIAALRIKRIIGTPWVAHFSDPTFLSSAKAFKSPLRTYLTHRDEKDIMRYADGITFVNRETLLGSTKFDPKLSEKCSVLSHCYDPDYFTERISGRSGESPIRIAYIGSLYSRRNPFDVISALELIARKSDGREIQFELHLYGKIDDSIKSRLDKNIPKWLIVHGPVSYQKSIEAMRSSDLLLLIDMPDETNYFTPSKLIDYLAAGKPIIGISSPKGSTAALLKDIGCEVCSPGDAGDIQKGLLKLLLERTNSVTERHGEVSQSFRAEAVIGSLVKILERATHRCRTVNAT